VVTKIYPRSYEEKSMRAAVTQSKSLIYINCPEAIIDVILLHAPWTLYRRPATARLAREMEEPGGDERRRTD
jgi:hypothetical protein